MPDSGIRTIDQPTSMTPATDPRTPLRQIAFLFLKLGTTAFGGPAAHIAMMDEEVVRRRRWLTEVEFLDYLSAANFIPGPNSTELAIHIGHRQAGWPGLIVAGTSFIIPAALMVGGLAYLYVTFGSLPQTTQLFYGMKPVVIAIIIQALWRLGRSAVKTGWLAVVAVTCLLMNGAGINELLVLALGGCLGLAPQWRRLHAPSARSLPAFLTATTASGSSAAIGLSPIFLVFAKIGSVLFGSGYVLLAFLRADLVQRYRWLSEKQLLDAIAVGQITPGPVFTTATFVGYLLRGPAGAVAATVGIFLPAFVFVALTAPLMPRLRASSVAAALLDGVNVASLALMAVVTWQLTRAAILDWFTLALALVSALLLLRFRALNSAWLILASAILGLAKSALRL
jgi:chromate transporter